jgi:hypothetical protein
VRAVSMTASEPTVVEPVQPIDPPHRKPLEKLALVLQQLRLLGYL